MLNTIRSLSREMAAAFNGLTANEKKCMAIGLGSLGSQVVNNLMRAGQGQWTFVDDDTYLPHNVARHYLPGLVVGYGKAKSMQSVLEGTFEDAKIQIIEADVLKPTSDELRETMEGMSLILDMSASVAVARELALSVNSPARRASLFLNPSGTDLVFLAESKDRTLRLDLLEMEYYWALIKNVEFSNHLFSKGAPIRYSHACRDVSVILPQDKVALHAAIGSRTIQILLREELTAQLRIWRTTDDMTTTLHKFNPEPYQRTQAGDWTLEVATRVLVDMDRQRTLRLPSETGGVLIGTFDTLRKIIYVIGFIPSPPDSIEWPTAYYRGTAGLQDELKRIEQVTGKQVDYVGEWHSHPMGSSTKPSGDDRKLFAWLQRHRLRDGFPAVIAIAGDDKRSTWYVDDLDTGSASYVTE
ncbi:ThiF family adenylyltransferase [Pontibacter rugosus]